MTKQLDYLTNKQTKLIKMKRKYLLSGIIFLSATLLPVKAQTGDGYPAAADAKCRQWVESVMSTLTPEAKAGQLVVARLRASADKATKRQATELTKRYKIGNVIFSGGTSEEQAILTNLARKGATVPLMVTAGGQRLSDLLSDVPRFPEEGALACVADRELRVACQTEMAREFRELDMCGAPLPEALGGANPLQGLLVSYGDGRRELAALTDSIRSGALSTAALDARCRHILACKYLLGLNEAKAPLQVSGLGYRVNSEEGRELAARLRRSAVTVLNNYFDVLPLSASSGDVAVLSIGPAGSDSLFVEAMKRETHVVPFHLDSDADEATAAAVLEQLQTCRRVVVSIVGSGFSCINSQLADQLAANNWKAPVIYVCFTPQLGLFMMEQALARSTASIVAHSADADIQEYMAALLFAKASAQGRLAVNVGRSFPAGAGCDILQGTQPVQTVPDDFGMHSCVLQKVAEKVQRGVDEGAYPGCRVLVWKDGKTVYDRGFGVHSPADATPVRPDDLFDLGSLTKPMATLLAVMKLYDEGKLALDDKASKYLSYLRNGNKRDITLRQLLFHEAGLPPYYRFYVEAIDPNSVHGPYAQSWEDQWHKTRISEHSYYCSDFKFKKGLVASAKSTTHPLQVAEGMWMNKSFKSTVQQKLAQCEMGGRQYVYSELGFLMLQQVVESVTGLPLDLYVAKEFYAPMGLQRTMFLPLQKFSKSEVMPTAFNDFLRRQDLCGYVHDETAACLGGVAGNAGLFSTAEEVAKVFQMLLDGGVWNGKRFLSEATCRLFTSETSTISHMGLGFDRPDASIVLRSPCAPSAPASVFGQTSLTGTCVWADPKNNLVFVFLSNRLCPNAWNTKLEDMNIRREVQELVYQSLR